MQLRMLYTSDYLEKLPDDSFLRSNYVENEPALQELESLLISQLNKKKSTSDKSYGSASPLKPPVSSSVSSSVNLTPLQAKKTLRELEYLSSPRRESSVPVSAGTPSQSFMDSRQRKWGRLVNVTGVVPPQGYSLYQLSLILGKGFDVDDLTAIQSSLNSADEECSSSSSQDCAVIGKKLCPSTKPKHLLQPFVNTCTAKSRTYFGRKPIKRKRRIRFSNFAIEGPDDNFHSVSADIVQPNTETHELSNPARKTADLFQEVHRPTIASMMTDNRHAAGSSSSARELLHNLGSANVASSQASVRFSGDELEDDVFTFSDGIGFDDIIQSHGSTFTESDFGTPSPVDRKLSTPDYVRDYLQRTLRDNSPSFSTLTDPESCTSSQDSLRVFYDDSSALNFTSSGTINASYERFSQPSDEGAHPRNQRSPLVAFPGRFSKSSLQRSQTYSNIRSKINDKREKSGSMPSVAYNAARRPPNGK